MRGGIKADIIGFIIWIGSSFYWLFVTTLKNLTSSHSHSSSSSSNTDDEKDNAKDAVSCDICFPKCFVVKCRRKSVIYVATVTNQITEQQMCFVGRTSQEFGTYYRETIRYSLENPKFKSMSSLGKYVWKLENEEKAQFKIRWFLFPQTDRNMNILEPLIRQYKGSVSNLRSHLTSEVLSIRNCLSSIY